MASLSPEFRAAVEQGTYEPIFLVEIEVSASSTFYFAKSSRRIALDVGPVPLSVASIPELESKIEPGLPKFEIPSLSITFKADDHVRDVIVDNRLKGKPVQVRIGFPNMTTRAQFANYWTGTFDDIDDDAQDGRITWKCMGDLILPRDRTVTGAWVARHPLQAFKGLLEFAGVPAARIDATSFDPDTYSTSISHWAISREQHGDSDRAVISPEEVTGLMEELAQILPGEIVVDEAGVIKFVEYDSGAAVAATWTQKEAEFHQIKGVGQFYNQVQFEFGWAGEGERASISDDAAESSSEYLGRLLTKDDTSQANYARNGATTYIAEHPPIASRWVGNLAGLFQDIDNTQTTLKLRSGNTGGFSGARVDGSSNAALNANRTLWLMIRSVNGTEVVKTNTALTTIVENVDPIPDYKYETTDIVDTGGVDTIAGLDVTGLTRSQLGTTAPAAGHPATSDDDDFPTEIYDITIAVAINDLIIARFAEGAPRITARTTLAQHGVELGDLVGVTWPNFTAYNFKGCTNAKFQVVSKRINLKTQTIDWGLLMDRAASTSLDWNIDIRTFPWDNRSWLDPAGWAGKNWTITLPGGLVAAIGNGAGGAARYRPPNAPKEFSHTFTASQDSYVGYDRYTGHYIVQRVANGAAAPEVLPYELRLGKVVTNGSAATSVDQSFAIRKTVGVLAPQLKGGLGPKFDIGSVPAVGDLEPGQWYRDANDAIFRRREQTYTELVNTLAATIPMYHLGFDEALDTSPAADLSGNGNDFTYVNLTQVTPGNNPAIGDGGSSVFFTNSGSVSGSARLLNQALGSVTKFSFATWVKLESIPGHIATICDHRDSGGTSDFRIRWQFAATTLEFTISGNVVASSTKSLQRTEVGEGPWILLGVTWDGTAAGALEVYVNEQLITSTTVSSGATLEFDDLFLGADGAAQNGLDGRLDRSVLWPNEVLALADFQKMFYAGQRINTDVDGGTVLGSVGALDSRNVPWATVEMTADSATVTSTGWSKVPFDRVRADPYKMFSKGVLSSLTEGTLTIPAGWSGYWRGVARVQFGGYTSGTFALAGIASSAGALPATPGWWSGYHEVTTTAAGMIVTTPLIYLAEGDVVAAYFFSENDVSFIIDADTAGAQSLTNMTLEYWGQDRNRNRGSA